MEPSIVVVDYGMGNLNSVKRNLFRIGVDACISDIGNSESYKHNLEKLILDKEFRNLIGNAGKITAEKEFSHLNCALPYIQALRSFRAKKDKL